MAQQIRDLLSVFGIKGDGNKRVLMLGLDGSGRTSTLYMLKLGEVVTTIPTIGFNVETIEIPHPTLGKTTITAWDVGGCDKIRPLWRHYFQATSGVMWFVDSGDRERLPEVHDELRRLWAEDELSGVPFLIAASKQDLPNAMSVEEIEERLGLRNITAFNGRDVNCMGISTREGGQGLYEAMFWLISAMDIYHKSPAHANKPPPRTFTAEEPLLTQWLKIEDEPDEQFIQAVEDFALASWDHRTHLRLAWLYLTLHGRREGMRRIFASIKAFIENSPRTKRKSGNGTTFHATLTYTWAHLVDFAIASTKNPTGTFKTFLMMNPQLSNGGLPLHYFTKKLLFESAESRQEVMLPDKRPLPSIITNVSRLKGGDNVSKPTPPSGGPAPQTDTQFLESVRDRSLNGWGHAAMLRVVWACLRLHGVRKGPDMAAHLLRTFQGQGFHATITTFWCQVLRKLIVQDWAPAVRRLDEAAVARAATWKLATTERLNSQQADHHLEPVSDSDAANHKADATLLPAHEADASHPQQPTDTHAYGSKAPETSTVAGSDTWDVASVADSVSSMAIGSKANAGAAGDKEAAGSLGPQWRQRDEYLDAFLTESAFPGATALIPTLPELLAGVGYASETLKKVILDQHMYLVHYSKQLIYSDGAAAAFVMPDRKPLPS